MYERDVKCQVKMSHNSGSVGQGPPSPSKDEVSPINVAEEVVAIYSANMEDLISST